ncbi:MAG TPA: dienelactone hydrolase family protein [Candidatus Binatia bacterium]|jgi:carboxymethylenebutenolidase
MSADETTSVAPRGRAVPVEIFRPRGTVPGPRPGVVVIHEIFGLNDDIRRIARRFADEGYVAAVPDLMAGGIFLACVVRAAFALRAGHGPAVDELEAIIALLESRPDVGKVGAVGFCMGGGFALLLGTRQAVGAAGVFYGDVRPREELARCCPLTGGYGERDRMFAPQGRRLIATLTELGKEHDVRLYPQAGHSYMNQAGHPVMALLTRPLMHVAYDAEAAEDSWRRMLAFFARHLGTA